MLKNWDLWYFLAIITELFISTMVFPAFETLVSTFCLCAQVADGGPGGASHGG